MLESEFKTISQDITDIHNKIRDSLEGPDLLMASLIMLTNVLLVAILSEVNKNASSAN